MGDIVGSGQDKQEWVHSEVTRGENQTANLIKNVRAFRITCLGMRPEMIQQVFSPEEN